MSYFFWIEEMWNWGNCRGQVVWIANLGSIYVQWYFPRTFFGGFCTIARGFRTSLVLLQEGLGNLLTCQVSPMSHLTGEMGGGHEKCSARDLGILAANNLGKGGPFDGWSTHPHPPTYPPSEISVQWLIRPDHKALLLGGGCTWGGR